MKKTLAMILVVCMLTTVLPVFGAFAAETVNKIVAEDSMYAAAYNVANDTSYANITNLNFGTGWSDTWSKFVKLDTYGMFLSRPKSTATESRVKRTLSEAVDFSKDGKYTFTVELCDGSSETQDYRFELGDTGIVFGAVVPKKNGYWYPQIKLPGSDMAIYSGETLSNFTMTTSKSMVIVFEVTAVSDGIDTLKIKLYGSDKAQTDWLMTVTSEISDKKVSYVNTGYNYYPTTDRADGGGVSRIRSVKIENETEAAELESEDFDANYVDWRVSPSAAAVQFTNPLNSTNNMRYNAAGLWKESLNVPEASTKPELINKSDAPSEVSGRSGITDKIVKVTQTANITMARMKSAILTPFKAGDTVRVSFKVYLTDLYDCAASFGANGEIIPAVKDEDKSVKTLPLRIVPHNGSADVDSSAKTINVPVNQWYTVYAEFNLTGNMSGVRFDFGTGASAAAVTGYTTPFAGTMYFDGNMKIGKDIEMPVERAEKSSWKEVSIIDFENSDKDYGVTSKNGEVTVLNTLVAQYPEAEVGTRGLNVYKFSMNENASSEFVISDFYDKSLLTVGDIVKVSAYVFAADVKGETPSLEMFAGNSNGAVISNDHSTGALKLKSDKWTKIGFTFTYTGNEKVLKIKSNGNSYFNTVLIDDIKTEVYKETGLVPVSYDYTDDMDTFNSKNSPYFKSPKFRAFGNGTWAIDIHKSEYNDGKSYSNGSSVKFYNRNTADIGMKINNIFQGIPNEDDIGKKYKISMYVYADKDAGVYQDKDVAFTEEMLAETKETLINLSLGGPDGSNYKYRTCNSTAKKFAVPWNTWTKIEMEYKVTGDYLDNGSKDSLANPLINAIRIDQSGADGSVNAGIASAIYVDDLKVKEVGETPVTLARCFASNMVLQRNKPITIWGESVEEGRNVTVNFGDAEKTTTTTDSGKWSVTFDALPAQMDLTMTFSYDGDDGETYIYKNIAIGDVILAAGQSNMALSYGSISNDVSDIEADTETLKKVRALKMSGIGSFDELTDNDSYSWISADTSLRKSVSAIGMITAYYIAKEQNVPVGIINASLGGARIEAFLSREVLESRDIYAEYIKDFEDIKSGKKELERWQYVPSTIYNYMLAPIKGLNMSACLWYQGANNRQTHDVALVDIYETKQQDLVDMFRNYFNNPDMPVTICQQQPYSDNTYDNQIIHIRQNQLNAAKRQKGVYLIPACDVGPVNADENGTGLIHPSNKRPLAERSYLALKHHNYGYEGEYTSPQYEYMEVEGNKAVLYLSHADGLKIKPNDGEDYVTGFTISQDGKNFVDANAVIDGNKIIVSAEGIENPVEVRYCYVSWTYYDAEGNLIKGKGFKSSQHTLTGHLGGNVYNAIDLPLAPFKATVAKFSVTSLKTEKADNKVKCDITLKNEGVSSADNVIMVALYSDSKLVDVKIIDSRFENAQSIDYNAVLDYETLGEINNVKVMVWDSVDSVRPVCKNEAIIL